MPAPHTLIWGLSKCGARGVERVRRMSASRASSSLSKRLLNWICEAHLTLMNSQPPPNPNKLTTSLALRIASLLPYTCNLYSIFSFLN
jgi:hypothetical protein